jgi:hypothetical protein
LASEAADADVMPKSMAFLDSDSEPDNVHLMLPIYLYAHYSTDITFYG